MAIEQKKLQCRRAVVHFIYSFSFATKEENPDEKTSPIKSYYIKVNQLKNALNESDNNNNDYSVKGGTPPTRQGIAQHLTFKSDSNDTAYIDIDRGRGDLNGDVLHTGGLVRLFPCASTCCIDVELPTAQDKKQYYGGEQISKILGLRKFTTGSDHNSSLQKLFKDKNGTYTLNEWFKSKIKKICHSSPEISWLGKDLDLIDPTTEYQSPWAVTVLEVEGELADIFCTSDWEQENPALQKAQLIQKYVNELAPLVYNTPASFILEPDYVNASTHGGIPLIHNMGVDGRLFVHVSRRGALCICKDMDKDPAKHFVRDLLNLSELLRARWHTLITMNKVLDHSLRKMRNQYQNDDIRDDAQLQEIMRLREWISLSLEDPGIYVIAGEFLSNLYDHLQSTFRIIELRNPILQKLDLLDKIFRDYQEMDWLDVAPKHRTTK